MHFVFFLFNIALWIVVGAYIGKYGARITRRPSKRFITIRMQKAALVAFLIGIFVAICNGTNDITAYIQNLLVIATFTAIYAFPTRLTYKKSKKLWKNRDEYIEKSLAKYLQYLPSHRS